MRRRRSPTSTAASAGPAGVIFSASGGNFGRGLQGIRVKGSGRTGQVTRSGPSCAEEWRKSAPPRPNAEMQAPRRIVHPESTIISPLLVLSHLLLHPTATRRRRSSTGGSPPSYNNGYSSVASLSLPPSMQASAMSSERYISFPNDYSPVAYGVESPVDPYTPTVFDYSSGQWSLNYPYLEPADYPTPHGCATHPTPIEHGSIPLHAPVPVSGYSTLLPPTYDSHVAEVPYAVERFGPVEEPRPPTQDDGNPLEVYSKAPQVLFPTPSELLTDLNSRERGARNDGDSPDKSPSKSALGRTSTRAKVELCDEPPENLNQRKAYFRAVSENVGFTVTDPDTITSHDKKRCYLECLEEYVQWLHDRIRLVGQEPLPLERVSSHRGLKSRSIRTMLVHKQDDISELNQRKLQEEQKFMDLQNAVLMRQATEESVQYRRHLMAMGAVPDMIPDYIQETP